MNILSWKYPCIPNGKIAYFNISFVGERVGYHNHIFNYKSNISVRYNFNSAITNSNSYNFSTFIYNESLYYINVRLTKTNILINMQENEKDFELKLTNLLPEYTYMCTIKPISSTMEIPGQEQLIQFTTLSTSKFCNILFNFNYCI